MMRMRAVRSLVLACISIVGCLVILSTLTNTTPTSPAAFHSLVTHTHHHLNEFQNNIKEEFESLVSEPDVELLLKLGFINDPLLYPSSNWSNLTTPVIATAVSSSDLPSVSNIISVASQVCQSANLLLYTLDLSQSQLEQVELLCNDTCIVVPFAHSEYPSHIRNWKLNAFRPIIIQELLVRAGSVLWLDSSIHLLQSVVSPLPNASLETNSDGGQFSESSSLYSQLAVKSSTSKMSSNETHNKKNLVTDDIDKNISAYYPLDQATLLHLDYSILTKNDSEYNSTKNVQNVGDRDKRNLELRDIITEEETINEPNTPTINIKANEYRHRKSKIFKNVNPASNSDDDFEEPANESSKYFIDDTHSAHEIEDCVLGDWRRAALENNGIITWQMSDPTISHLPTTALTHSDMFAAMHVPKHLYDFHRMSDAGAILLYNTEAVHYKLMKPWLTCSLTHHCVQPIGAQDTGCRYDKKPLFRYSGCHLYDTSAFNVALGIMYGPNNLPFHLESPFFTRTPFPTPSIAQDAPLGSRTGVRDHTQSGYGHPLLTRFPQPKDS